MRWKKPSPCFKTACHTLPSFLVRGTEVWAQGQVAAVQECKASTVWGALVCKNDGLSEKQAPAKRKEKQAPGKRKESSHTEMLEGLHWFVAFREPAQGLPWPLFAGRLNDDIMV
eukprot:1136842-Pelagomonas_calceolata.AAC.9